MNNYLCVRAQFIDKMSNTNTSASSKQLEVKDIHGIFSETLQQAQVKDYQMIIGRQLREMEELRRSGQGLAICGDYPKVCQSYLSMMRTLDTEDTNIVFLKGLFTDYLGKPGGIAGINAPYSMASAESLCKKVDDKIFPTAKSIMDWMRLKAANRFEGIDFGFFIERCVNQFGLTEDVRKEYLIKFLVTRSKIRSAIGLAEGRLSKISNEISRPTVEEVKNRCNGKSSFLVKNCLDAFMCSLDGASDEVLEQDNKNICSSVPGDILNHYQKELANSSGLRKKVVCLMARKKYINLLKGQKVLKDGKIIALGDEAEDPMELLAVSEDPELLLLDLNQSIEKNFQRVVDQKKEEQNHLKQHLEKLKLADNCLNGFVSDSKKCNGQDAYDLLQEPNLFPSVVDFAGDPDRTKNKKELDKKELVLIEHGKRQDCLFQARFQQQAKAALIASGIQDAALLVIPIGGSLLAAARFVQGVKGLRAMKNLASAVNSSKAGGILMTTLNSLPAIDGAAAAYSSCISSLDYRVRSGNSGKVNMKISTCNTSEIKLEQDRKQCGRDLAITALGIGIPFARSLNSKFKGSVGKLSPSNLKKVNNNTENTIKFDSSLAVLSFGTHGGLYWKQNENMNDANSSVISIDPAPLFIPKK